MASSAQSRMSAGSRIPRSAHSMMIFATRSTIGSSRLVSFNSRKASSKAVTIALTTSGSKILPCNSQRIGILTSDMARPPELSRAAFPSDAWLSCAGSGELAPETDFPKAKARRLGRLWLTGHHVLHETDYNRQDGTAH